MNSEVMMVVVVWLMSLGLQTITGLVLLTSPLGEKLLDGGWAFGRAIGWLGISLVIWWVGNAGGELNNNLGVWLVVLLMGVMSLIWIIKEREKVKTRIKASWKLVLVEEIIFGVGFGWMVWVRGFKPDILDLEKFMDYGLMESYLKSETLPVMDMWLAGKNVNYYTFGHFMGSVLVRIWRVDLRYGYNLLLGFVMGISLMQMFSLIVNISREEKRKKGIVGGLLGVILLGWGGNTHTFWYWLKNQTMSKYWYADATRFINNTIHEFPAYSFIVSDLHAHVWSLPIVMLYLVLVWLWMGELSKRGRASISAMMGMMLGVMAMTNTWDVFGWGMILPMAGIVTWRNKKVRWWEIILSGAIVLGAAMATAYQWWAGFEAISQGVAWVKIRSPLSQLGALWGGHLLLVMIAVWTNVAIKKKGVEIKNWLVLILTAMALALITIPEIIYIKDIYPNHPRANTMFKFTYQACVMMTVVIGWGVNQLVVAIKRKGKLTHRDKLRFGLLPVVLTMSMGMVAFSYFGYRDYFGFGKWRGLDGMEWLRVSYPDDYEGVNFLKRIEGRRVVLEAVGDSYTKFGRVSVFSGMPTVLGWRVHEWLWRGGYDMPGKRTEEVKTVYEKPRLPIVRGILEEHNVDYIFLGSKEREIYKIDEVGIRKLGEVVFESGKTVVFKVR